MAITGRFPTILSGSHQRTLTRASSSSTPARAARTRTFTTSTMSTPTRPPPPTSTACAVSGCCFVGLRGAVQQGPVNPAFDRLRVAALTAIRPSVFAALQTKRSLISTKPRPKPHWQITDDGNTLMIAENVSDSTGLGLGVHTTIDPKDAESYAVSDGQKDIFALFDRRTTEVKVRVCGGGC